MSYFRQYLASRSKEGVDLSLEPRVEWVHPFPTRLQVGAFNGHAKRVAFASSLTVALLTACQSEHAAEPVATCASGCKQWSTTYRALDPKLVTKECPFDECTLTQTDCKMELLCRPVAGTSVTVPPIRSAGCIEKNSYQSAEHDPGGVCVLDDTHNLEQIQGICGDCPLLLATQAFYDEVHSVKDAGAD